MMETRARAFPSSLLFSSSSPSRGLLYWFHFPQGAGSEREAHS